MAIFFEPVFCFAVIGAEGGHQQPKVFTVVRVAQMANFVSDEVINHPFRRLHDQPVVLDVA